MRFEDVDETGAVEKRYMAIHRKMVQKGEEVIQFAVMEHDLFIVTMSRIFKCKMVSNKSITR